jgi:hypothetical protein
MVAVGHLVHKYDEIICSVHQGGAGLGVHATSIRSFFAVFAVVVVAVGVAAGCVGGAHQAPAVG